MNLINKLRFNQRNYAGIVFFLIILFAELPFLTGEKLHVGFSWTMGSTLLGVMIF
jgi:hypothetical protein